MTTANTTTTTNDSQSTMKSDNSESSSSCMHDITPTKNRIVSFSSDDSTIHQKMLILKKGGNIAYLEENKVYTTTEINSLKEFLNDPQGWREKNE